MAHSSVFHRRRDSFLSGLGSYAAIVPAGELVTHHADCEYPFRQNSDFWYLTGFDEPNAVALFLPHKPKGSNTYYSSYLKSLRQRFGQALDGEQK